MSLVNIPRVSLVNLPTPLNELKNLSATLSGPRIFVKREDLTGLGMGGNKSRKLEFIMADVKQKGYDAVVSFAGSQSNWCLQVAAAARKLGMEAAFVHFSGHHPEMQGNRLLHNILGSQNEILEGELKSEEDRTVVTGECGARKDEVMGQFVEQFRRKGRKAIIINPLDPKGPYNLKGTAAYVNATEELEEQLRVQNVEANYLVVCTGSGNTHSGLVLGVKALKLPIKVVGISISKPAVRAINDVLSNANDTAKFLGLDVSITPDEVTVYDDYIGAGYGAMTEEGLEAIRLVARTEGFFLDPVYTGKTMSGLIDLIRKGEFTSRDTVVFIHTGGLGAVFAYHKELVG